MDHFGGGMDFETGSLKASVVSATTSQKAHRGTRKGSGFSVCPTAGHSKGCHIKTMALFCQRPTLGSMVCAWPIWEAIAFCSHVCNSRLETHAN